MLKIISMATHIIAEGEAKVNILVAIIEVEDTKIIETMTTLKNPI